MVNHLILAASADDEWTQNSILDPIFGVLVTLIVVLEVLYVYRQEHAAPPTPPPPPAKPKR